MWLWVKTLKGPFVGMTRPPSFHTCFGHALAYPGFDPQPCSQQKSSKFVLVA